MHLTKYIKYVTPQRYREESFEAFNDSLWKTILSGSMDAFDIYIVYLLSVCIVAMHFLVCLFIRTKKYYLQQINLIFAILGNMV